METLPGEDDDFPIMKERITDQYLPLAAARCWITNFTESNDRRITGRVLGSLDCRENVFWLCSCWGCSKCCACQTKTKSYRQWFHTAAARSWGCSHSVFISAISPLPTWLMEPVQEGKTKDTFLPELPCIPGIRGQDPPAFLATVSHARLHSLHAETQSSQKAHLVFLKLYKTLELGISWALKCYLCTKIFSLFLDVGKIVASPWSGGYTFSAPGLKNVGAAFSVLLQMVNQQKMCYRF